MSNANKNKRSMSLGKFLSDWGAVCGIVILFVAFSILEPKKFLTAQNMLTILRTCAIPVVIAMGSTFAFSAGVFDLSIGSQATMGAVFALSFRVWYGMPMVLAVLLAILACVLIGALNSLLVLRFKINAMLTTLSMQFMVNGLCVLYTGGGVVTPTRPGQNGQAIVATVPNWFWSIGKTSLIIVVMVICILVVAFFQNYTKHGRYLYMVGSNAEASRLSGISVVKYRALAFILTSFFAGLGGVLIVSRVGTVSASAGGSYLMPAIAAVNIGTSVAGVNKPNAIGTIVGALLMAIMENGLFMMAVSYDAIDIAKGAILLACLLFANMANSRTE